MMMTRAEERKKIGRRFNSSCSVVSVSGISFLSPPVFKPGVRRTGFSPRLRVGLMFLKNTNGFIVGFFGDVEKIDTGDLFQSFPSKPLSSLATA